MNKITLEQAYQLLKTISRVDLEGDVCRMRVKLNDEGLVITLKKFRETTVMLMPKERNERVEHTENFISFYDGSNWRYDFIPLVPANLHEMAV
jgi:hypothetical protein